MLFWPARSSQLAKEIREVVIVTRRTVLGSLVAGVVGAARLAGAQPASKVYRIGILSTELSRLTIPRSLFARADRVIP